MTPSPHRGDKLQGETGERVRQLERSLEEEVNARTTREKALRDEVEKKLDEIKVYSDEGLNGIRKMTEVGRGLYGSTKMIEVGMETERHQENDRDWCRVC